MRSGRYAGVDGVEPANANGRGLTLRTLVLEGGQWRKSYANLYYEIKACNVSSFEIAWIQVVW